MIQTQSQLIAEGFTLDPSARFGIRRQVNAVGDIPEGHKVAFIDAKGSDEGPYAVDNITFLNPEQAKERLSQIRSHNAKKPGKATGLPTGIVNRKPGYYVASFMRNGKWLNKAGKDKHELTVWLLRERDGLRLGQDEE